MGTSVLLPHYLCCCRCSDASRASPESAHFPSTVPSESAQAAAHQRPYQHLQCLLSSLDSLTQRSAASSSDAARQTSLRAVVVGRLCGWSGVLLSAADCRHVAGGCSRAKGDRRCCWTEQSVQYRYWRGSLSFWVRRRAA